MLRPLLLLAFLCTCGSAPLGAQLTLGLEGGIGYGTLNHRPTIPDPTFEPTAEEKIRAVGGDALALHIGYAPADKKLHYSLRLQYLSRGYQHIVVERSPNFVLFQDLLTSEVKFLDFLPGIHYNINRQLSFEAGPYFSVALSEKNAGTIMSSGQRLRRPDYGIHLRGRYQFGRFYAWVQFQQSLQPFDYSVFDVNYPNVRAIPNPSPVSVAMWGIGYQIIR